MKKYFLSISLLIATVFSYAQTIPEIQGSGADSPYDGQEVTTGGIVTAKSNIAYFIQDGTAIRSGIYVYDQEHFPEIGDEVILTATVDEFYNLTELVDVTAFSVISSGNDLPAPLEITTAEVSQEDYESMLVKVSGATCTNTDLGYGEWEVDDGSGPCAVDDLLFMYSPTLGIEYSVTGPCYYSFDAFKIVPQNADGIVIDVPLYFTREPSEKEITTNSITIDWETNTASNTVIEYGMTPALELGTLTDMTMLTAHEITLTGLDPGTIYYVRPYSQAGVDETPTKMYVMSTASHSSGEINVYFNHEVNHEVATVSEAVYTPAIVDTIIAYLNLAQITLDITMYETENQEIVDAINAAYDRGVTVRVISDDEGNNSVFDNLNPDIPYLEGNAEGIMHDKFILIDRDDVDNAWVMTGSMNHTVNNLGWDFNNIICIQDQSLARGYTLEFNEMWGSDGEQPDTGNAKFGSQKADNTPHKYNINNILVESYFSPTDNVTGKINSAIDAAEDNLIFAVLVFTDNNLGNAVLDAHNRGVEVKGIIDYVEFNGSEFGYLVDNEVNVKDYQNADGSQWPDGPTLHHKYAVIDFMEGSENPLLITGSHNWTASAESIHDENTLFIHDAEVANWYYQEFHARFFGVVDTEELELLEKQLKISPNPVWDELVIEVPEQGYLKIYDAKGSLIRVEKASSGLERLDVADFTKGVYFLVLEAETKIWTSKFIKH